MAAPILHSGTCLVEIIEIENEGVLFDLLDQVRMTKQILLFT